MDEENKMSETKEPNIKPVNPPMYTDIYSESYNGTKMRAGLLGFPLAK